MSDSFRVSAIMPTTPQRVYGAWLSSKEHGAMTGGEEAKITARIGGGYMAGSGYIEGKTLSLEPYGCIVQSWRTTDFPKDSPHSRLEIHLEEAPRGMRITLVHSEIPEGQGSMYRDGWKEFYFKPMKTYFSTRAAPTEA